MSVKKPSRFPECTFLRKYFI